MPFKRIIKKGRALFVGVKRAKPFYGESREAEPLLRTGRFTVRISAPFIKGLYKV